MLTAALFIGLISLTNAQQKMGEYKSPEQRAERMTAMMDQKLHFTADQKTKVYNINLERAKKMEKLMKERKALMDESRQKMDKVLTDSQRKALDQMKAERQQKMKEHWQQGKQWKKENKANK